MEQRVNGAAWRCFPLKVHLSMNINSNNQHLQSANAMLSVRVAEQHHVFRWKKDLIHFFLLWSPPAELYEFLRSCFQKPLVFFLLRDRRQCLETQWESSCCSNQKWHNVNKYTDYSAHLFCTMQLMRFIIQKTLWKPNKHSLSFVLMRVNRGSWWLTGETVVDDFIGVQQRQRLPMVWCSRAGRRCENQDVSCDLLLCVILLCLFFFLKKVG